MFLYRGVCKGKVCLIFFVLPCLPFSQLSRDWTKEGMANNDAALIRLRCLHRCRCPPRPSRLECFSSFRLLCSPLVCKLIILVLFIIIHTAGVAAISTGDTLLSTNIFGTGSISPTTLWQGITSGNLVLTIRGYNCSFPSMTVATLHDNLKESATSQPFAWNVYVSTLITTAGSVTPHNPPSVMYSIATVTLRAAPGFVMKTNALTVQWEGNSGSAFCRASTTQLTISPNSGGGFATIGFCTDGSACTADVTHEYDIQDRTLTLVVKLQYNVFITGSPFVTITSPTELVSGWTFVRGSDNFTLVGTHSAVPAFNIAAGQTKSMIVVVPAAQTYLGLAPTPSTTTFTIDAVDGNPVAYCRLSNNVTDKMIRQGLGTVDITLSPSNKDFFKTYGTPNEEELAWNGTIVASTQLPTGVSVTYRVVSTTRVRLNFTATSKFFMSDAVSVVFTPRPSVLRSVTAGCGVLQLPIIPAPVDLTVSLEGGGTGNITELDVQFRGANFTASIEFPLFRSNTILPPCTTAFRNSPVCFDISATASSPLGALETRFLAALEASNTTISASATTDQRLFISIPPLPRYNIDYDKIECVIIRLPPEAVRSGVAPTTVSMPTFCITGVPVTATVKFASSGKNITNATLLWDQGDVLMISLIGGVWNTSAVWSEGQPLLFSTFGAFNSTTLGYSAIQFSNITFSTDSTTIGRVAYVPFVRCLGLSVLSDEIGTVGSMEGLVDHPGGLQTRRVTFDVTQPNSSVVSFNCSNICTMQDTESSVYIDETKVRSGFSFLVASVYDVLVDQPTLHALRWSIFTRNASSIVNYPGVSLAVVKVNRFTARFTFSPMPDFDIALDEISVIYLNASFLRNKAIRSAPRGFLFFRTNVPQPVCSMTNFTPAISERDIQNGDVNFFFQSSLPLAANACSMLATGAWTLSFFTTSRMPLNVTIGNCTKYFNATGGLLPLTIHQNASYDVTSNDVMVFSFNRKFFVAQERCSFDPTVDIPVLPANTYFEFAYVTESANGTVVKHSLPFVADPSYSVLVSERLFRTYGMHIRVNFTGELIKLCTFPLQFTILLKDQRTINSTNFAVEYGTVATNMTATNASNCEPGVSSSAIFEGTLPPKPYDIASIENITFYVGFGVGFGQAAPVAFRNTVAFVPDVEDSTGTLRYNDTLSATKGAVNQSMRPLPASTLGFHNPPSTLAPKWSFISAVVRAETLCRGGFTTSLELLGDRWASNAPALLVAALSILEQRFAGTVNATLEVQNPSQVALTSINRLFPATTAKVAFNVTTLRSTLTFTSLADPSFYLTSDAFFQFNIPSQAIDSGIVPTPSWLAMNVTFGPPSLEASGPAFRGGTRRLLLGMLYLIVRLLDDNFIPTSVSGPIVCPKAFDTCSITVDSTKRFLNISFPPQDLVIFTRTEYRINVTQDNVASHRNISNQVSFTLDVESGILSSISLGTENAEGGIAVSEAHWRDGVVGSLSFVLKGDSFVDSAVDILAALKQRTVCYPPSDAYGFCSRLTYMLAGTVQELEVSRQSIRVDLQADSLFDVYRPELVVLSFGGVGTTSTFAPVFLSNLSFVVQPTNGVVTMTTTFPATAASPLAANDLRDGVKQIIWTFSLAGERWDVGSTFPFVATSSGASLRQLVVAAFNSSINTTQCPTKCFNALRGGLFADDVTVSSDRRTLQIVMVGNLMYDSQFVETVRVEFHDPRMFLSGLVPMRSSISSSDWVMVINPSGAARLEVNRISPAQLSLDTQSTSSSAFVIVVPEHIIQSVGVNVSIRMLGAPVYLWDVKKFNGTSVAFASKFTTSTSPVALEPQGFLSQASSMVDVFAGVSSGAEVTFSLRPSPKYRLAISAGETVTFTMPNTWTTSTASSTALLSVAPSTLQFKIIIAQVSVVLLVRKSSLTDTCPTVATMHNFLSNVSTFMQATAQVQSSTTSVLSSQYCNVSLVVQTTAATNALDARTRLVSTAPAELRECCSIAIAFDPMNAPTEEALMAAVGRAPNPPPEETNVGEQITWVFVSIGILVALIGAYYCYRNHISGDAFSGTSRVRAEELHDVWTMKLVVDEEDEDILEQRAREQHQQSVQQRSQRIHWDASGNPTLSSSSAAPVKGDQKARVGTKSFATSTPASMDDAANETVFAGQPNRSNSLYRHTSAPVNVTLVELPILANEDDIPIAPNAIDGMVISMNQGGEQQGETTQVSPLSQRQEKRLPRLRRPSEKARFELL